MPTLRIKVAVMHHISHKCVSRYQESPQRHRSPIVNPRSACVVLIRMMRVGRLALVAVPAREQDGCVERRVVVDLTGGCLPPSLPHR